MGKGKNAPEEIENRRRGEKGREEEERGNRKGIMMNKKSERKA